MKNQSQPGNAIENTRYLWAALAAGCVGAAVLTACGGGGASAAATPAAPNEPTVSTPVELTPSTPGDLLSYVKAKIKQAAVQESNFNMQGLATTSAGPLPVAAPTEPTLGVAAFSGTRLQELGVDEDDLVKTDGNMLYALTKPYWDGRATVPAQLQAQSRMADGQLAAAGVLALGPQTRSGIYLASAAKRIAVLGQQDNYGVLTAPAAGPVAGPVSLLAEPYQAVNKIGLDIVSLDVPNTLTFTKRVRIDGQMVGSRMIGHTLYVVSTWSPNLAKYALSTTATASEQDAKLASLSSSEVLPSVQINDGPAEPLLADSDCYVHAGDVALQVQITSITAFDLSSDTLQRNSRCVVGGSEALYMSPTNVYLTSSRFYSFDPSPTLLANTVFRSGSTTDIHKFGLLGQTISYKGSGTVPGHLGWDKAKLAYRMSEYQGDLRVVSFTGQTGWGFATPFPGVATVNAVGGSPTATATTSSGTAVSATPAPLTPAPASPATLTVLREATGKGLQVVGSLPNAQRPAALGHPGEQVYAVQFVGPRAYVVTFRQTDPLYVLDVSNPADPKALGELAMPGFSDYLYPLGDSLLLGVGKDATDAGFLGGVKLALMDVADPSKPRLIQLDRDRQTRQQRHFGLHLTRY